MERVHNEVVAGVGLRLAKPGIIVRNDVHEEVHGVCHRHEDLSEHPNRLVRLFPEAGLVPVQDYNCSEHGNKAKEWRWRGYEEEDDTEKTHW